jgi:uncharacterized protein
MEFVHGLLVLDAVQVAIMHVDAPAVDVQPGSSVEHAAAPRPDIGYLTGPPDITQRLRIEATAVVNRKIPIAIGSFYAGCSRPTQRDCRYGRQPGKASSDPVSEKLRRSPEHRCTCTDGFRRRRIGIMTETLPPLPPFTLETAVQKVQAAEDAWNTRDPEHVSQAYTTDSHWRNRDLHIVGRAEIVAFLTRKWQTERDYVLRKSLWDFRDNRIAVRFQYEWHDDTGQWYRSYGNELWEFTQAGLMARREASINDVAINESQRRYFGPRLAQEYRQDIPLW